MRKVGIKKSVTASKGRSIQIDEVFATRNELELILKFFEGKKPNNERDRRSFREIINSKPRKTEDGSVYPKSTLKPVFEILKYVKNAYDIPPDSASDMIVDYAFRCASSKYPGPKKSTAMRVIVNYGCKEQYEMGVGKKKYLMSGEVIALGPAPLCPNVVKVSGNPRYKLDLPNGKQRTTIKPRNYTRLTILIDFYISDQYCEILEDQLEKIDQKGKVGKIAKVALEQILSEYREKKRKEMEKVKLELEDL